MKEETPTKKLSLSERFDSVIAFFSPRIAYGRKIFRYAGQYALTAYRGAEKNRLRSSWLPGGGSADQNLLSELGDLRERSRDLNRNDGHAAGITGTMVTNVVGTGIRPQSRVDRDGLGISDEVAEEFQKRAERIWQKWVPFADSTDRMDFYEIQQLVDRQILENGEIIILPLMLEDNRRPYKLALEIVEADRLQTPVDKRSDKSIRSGVEIGEKGEPVAYWIRRTHPGDLISYYGLADSNKFERIPAKNESGRPNVLHLYWVLRPGQTRGVPFFAPVMTMFKDLAEYLESELLAARVASCFSLFIKKNDPFGASSTFGKQEAVTNKKIETIEPGIIEYLNPGEDISSFNPQRPGGSFEPFVDRILRAIGAALGLPYELVAKDFSKTNYSSARAALLEARRYFRCRQEWLSRRLCQPSWEMLMEEAFLTGELPVNNFYEKRLDWVRVRWISPGWPWVDPLKEVKAAKEAIEANISNLADEVAGGGKDWEEVMEQRAREEALRKKLDLPEMSKGKKLPSEEENEQKETAEKEKRFRLALEKIDGITAQNNKLRDELKKESEEKFILKEKLSEVNEKLAGVLING